MTDATSSTPMDKSIMEQAARDQFWFVDSEIKKVEAELAVIDVERNALADEETDMRDKVRAIGQRKMALVNDSNMPELCRERSRYAVFLNRKTGTRDNH